MDDICTTVRFAMDQLGVCTLKDKQSFVRGHDCFVILPTGYGKTMPCCLSCSTIFEKETPVLGLGPDTRDL